MKENIKDTKKKRLSLCLIMSQTAIILASSLLLFVGLEMSVRVILRLQKEFFNEREITASARPLCETADQNRAWEKSYQREFDNIGVRWEPYTYWRRQEYNGEYINIDANGLRKTWNPSFVSSSDPLVFIFGGSTIWGTGARDEFTIPSFISKQLSEKNLPCRIVNMGESAYVSTQQIIALVRQLQQNNVPDVVVFYDGFNDTWSAYQQGVPGIPQNEENRKAEFNALKWPMRLFIRLLAEQVDNLAVVQVCRGMHRRLFQERAPNSRGDGCSKSLMEQHGYLAENVIDTYRANIDILNALSNYYGFQVLCYWQPTLFTKRRLASQEKQIKNTLTQRNPKMEKFYANVYKLMRERSSAFSNWQNIESIFDNYTFDLYIDECHVDEKGNEIVAYKMSADIAKVLLEDSQRSSPH